ncbi:MAG: DUF1223 domain-containing protein [Proteobacteria bacterium]|nr:DUF1223 domain-containing protein [Pseudomonadota bacterium]
MLKLAYAFLIAAPFAGEFACAANNSRPAVVELYTSQGCSSCPPADLLLGVLSQRPNVLALAFHVDYWNDLGWTDPYSLRDAVIRQSAYSKARGQSSVYTPQVVVDGHDEYLGSDRSNIEHAVAELRTGVPVTLQVSNRNLVIALGGAQCLAPSDVLAITYLRKATSKIGRGENSGRTLEEFNIVRSIRTIGQWTGTAATFEVPLSTLPRDATDFAVLVQLPGQAQIIGAATLPLP